jgi:hypothetical protein
MQKSRSLFKSHALWNTIISYAIPVAGILILIVFLLIRYLSR